MDVPSPPQEEPPSTPHTGFDPDTIPPPSPAPRTLIEWAVLVLNTASPLHKVAYTRHAAEAFSSGVVTEIGGGTWDGETWSKPDKETPPVWPPRLPEEQRVAPGFEPKRGRGGTERSRIALLHSLANIEQWAIDLAWDIVARGPQLSARLMQTEEERTPLSPLPREYYADFVKVALDEAKHFTLLQRRMLELGSHFGALPVHHALWESAVDTSDNLFARLSVIHLVHEARGLDVNPQTIRKFEAAGDELSVLSLRTIHLDEITHVAAGHRWLVYLCQIHKPPLDPIQVFRSAVREKFCGRLKGPFNTADRAEAGLSSDWYKDLVGERASRNNAPIIRVSESL